MFKILKHLPNITHVDSSGTEFKAVTVLTISEWCTFFSQTFIRKEKA